MTISSRTPEGSPLRCPICLRIALLEPCDPGGDSVCPGCGHLLWWFRDRIGEISDMPLERITFDTLLGNEIDLDSLDLAEIVMALEIETGITIPDEAARQFRSVRDIITYLRQREEE